MRIASLRQVARQKQCLAVWSDGPLLSDSIRTYSDKMLNAIIREVNAKLEKPVNFLANWRQNKGIRRGVSGAYLL